MALSYAGLLPIPVIVPSVYLALGVSIGIEASITGSLSLNASLQISPPTIALYLAALVELEAQLSLAIELALPSISFDLSATLDLVASLELALSALVSLELLLDAAIGLYEFSYNGPANALGSSLGAELASTWPDGNPSSGDSTVLILGAVSPIAQTQIQKFLNGLSVGSGLVYVAKASAMSALSVVTGLAIGQGRSAINAQLSAALTLKASASITPPALAVTASALASFAAMLTAQLNLAPPSIHAALSATASFAASLSAQFGFVADLGACLNRYDAELFCYAYTGPANALGGALTTALATTWGDGSTPTSGQCFAAILGAADSATATVLTGFFGGV